jgi:hypothetical protein
MAPGSVMTKARSSIVVLGSQVEAEVSAEDIDILCDRREYLEILDHLYLL